MDFATYLRDSARIDGDARFCSVGDADRAAILAAAPAILADAELLERLAAVAGAIRTPQETWDAAPWCGLQYDPRGREIPPPHLAYALAFPLLFHVGAARADYAARSIPESILADTLRDLPRCTDILAERTGGRFRGFTEIHWLREHLSLRLFRLGRLQFQPRPPEEGVEALSPEAAAEPVVMGVHIPGGEPLDIGQCRQSLAMAPGFFAKYFPGEPVARARFFQCSSWLLCPALVDALPESSRIRAFASLFTVGVPHGDDETFYDHAFPALGRAATAADAATSLQRAVIGLRERGVAMREHVGIIPVAPSRAAIAQDRHQDGNAPAATNAVFRLSPSGTP